MLSNDILNALKQYTAAMQNNVTFVVQTGEHSKRAELMEFLLGVASVSDRIAVEERDTQGALRSPISFMLEVDGAANGIQFSGIPSGHEFNSLILAVLHSSGTALKLDASIQETISHIDQALQFQVYVSLSCHNCPDVVQALNQFAVVSPNISVEMIDGGLYPSLIEENNVQGVPAVFLNGKPFASGKVDTATLLDKLIETFPNIAQAPSDAQLPEQDVTVIGAGPSGVAAAIYAARKGLKVTMIADRIGGQVKDTMGIENLISVPKTTGPELTGNLIEHLNDYTITRREHLRVVSVKSPEDSSAKTVELSSGEIITTRSIIIATGAKWRELGVPGEKENIGNGVAYCPHCDGPFFKGKDVAVVGGGNSGIEAALDLSGIVSSVTVYEFMPDLKADQVLIDQANKRENITIKTHVAVQEVIADNGKVVALSYQDRETDRVEQDQLSGVFVQIGLVPNSDFVKGLVETTKSGEIVINERGETSTPGIFACGDVTTVPYKQIVIAMGEGAKASLSAFDYLMRQG